LRDAGCAWLAPAWLRHELTAHLPEVARRSGAPVARVEELAEGLLGLLTEVPDSAWLPLHGAALDALEGNAKDAPYLAVALATGADAIWSRDQGFDVQTLVPRVEWP
jgi:predicted nucleic acid-binding protein